MEGGLGSDREGCDPIHRVLFGNYARRYRADLGVLFLFLLRSTLWLWVDSALRVGGTTTGFRVGPGRKVRDFNFTEVSRF